MITVEKVLLERIQELSSELDFVKVELAHEVKTLTEQRDELRDMLEKTDKDYDGLVIENDKLEDAADYWKETFETFYNAIYIATARPSESHSDGDCIEEIIDKLKAYNGESDELHELKY